MATALQWRTGQPDCWGDDVRSRRPERDGSTTVMSAEPVKFPTGTLGTLRVRAAVTDRILREAGFEDQVADAIAAIKTPSAAALTKGIKQMFRRRDATCRTAPSPPYRTRRPNAPPGLLRGPGPDQPSTRLSPQLLGVRVGAFS
jgi:hypothetical protein